VGGVSAHSPAKPACAAPLAQGRPEQFSSRGRCPAPPPGEVRLRGLACTRLLEVRLQPMWGPARLASAGPAAHGNLKYSAAEGSSSRAAPQSLLTAPPKQSRAKCLWSRGGRPAQAAQQSSFARRGIFVQPRLPRKDAQSLLESERATSAPPREVHARGPAQAKRCEVQASRPAWPTMCGPIVSPCLNKAAQHHRRCPARLVCEAPSAPSNLKHFGIEGGAQRAPPRDVLGRPCQNKFFRIRGGAKRTLPRKARLHGPARQRQWAAHSARAAE
jgi:hypothetical protein